MVYVKNVNGKPLMPCSHAKARHLLEQKKAVIVKRMPFTIQLKFVVDNKTQPVILGIDAGSKIVGISAVSNNMVLYESEVTLRNDIVKLLSEKRAMRRSRRNRKTRYRKARFDNRVRSKNKGWLAPSVEQKITTHLKSIETVCSILPISTINIEVASFDMQKIRNPEIESTGYQQGNQLGFWNVREYVLFRDDHQCQHCHGKSKDRILNVHHIQSRQTGGNSPDNLITLCETCHKAHHQGKINLSVKRNSQSLRDAAFMGIMKWTVYNRLKEKYPEVNLTYGYITKNTRIENNLPKEHFVDARYITGQAKAKPDNCVYKSIKLRSHNRQIHKATILKGNIRKLNQCPKMIYGFKHYDMVSFEKQNAYVHARRTSGAFDIRKPDGEVISHGLNYKKLQFVEHAKQYLIYKENLPIPPQCRA